MAISRRSRYSRSTKYRNAGGRMVAPGGRRSRVSRVGGRSRAAASFRAKKQVVHSFKQICIPQNLAYTSSTGNKNGVYDTTTGQLTGPSSTADDNGYFACDFRISDIPNISSLSALFDSYRINKVVLDFQPVHNVAPTGSLGTPTDQIPTPLYTVLDSDDVAAPTTLTEVEQYETLKITPAFRRHVRVVTPAVAIAVYRTGVTFGYMPGYKKWLDLATNDIPHYGIKGLIKTNATAANNAKCAWNVRATYYVSFKGVR